MFVVSHFNPPPVCAGVASCNNSQKAVDKRARSLGRDKGAFKRDTRLPHERFDLDEFVNRKAEQANNDGVIVKAGVVIRVNPTMQGIDQHNAARLFSMHLTVLMIRC